MPSKQFYSILEYLPKKPSYLEKYKLARAKTLAKIPILNEYVKDILEVQLIEYFIPKNHWRRLSNHVNIGEYVHSKPSNPARVSS